MKWNKRPDIYGNYLPWFAWYPVEVRGRVVWLETTHRIRVVDRFTFEGYWLYRP